MFFYILHNIKKHLIYKQPLVSSIKIYNLLVLEPAATITDLAVAAMCFYAFFNLKKEKRNDTSFKHFKLFFLSMGFATIFGGLIGHAFIYAFNLNWKLLSWFISMISISILVNSTIKHAKDKLHPIVVKTYEIVNIVELIIFMTITFITIDFFYVGIHSSFGLSLIFFPIQLYIYLKTKNKSSRLFLIGLGILLISGISFSNKISLNFWIGHIAISHSIMAIAVYYFYKAGMSLALQEEYPKIANIDDSNI